MPSASGRTIAKVTVKKSMKKKFKNLPDKLREVVSSRVHKVKELLIRSDEVHPVATCDVNDDDATDESGSRKGPESESDDEDDEQDDGESSDSSDVQSRKF